MPLTIPKPLVPILIKPMTPPWVLALVIAAQFAFAQIGNDSQPSCILNVQRPHHSTHMVEQNQENAIKLNITSECTVSQSSTSVSANLFALRNNTPVLLLSIKDRIAFADKKDSTRAIYRDLYINCQSGAKELYFGSANGSVLLTNGKHIPVRGNSGNYYPEVCGNRAK
jgi:hypothetical protein